MKDLIKKILIEESEKKDLIVPSRLDDRPERYKRIVYKQIQEYIKNGSVGNLNLSGSPIDSLPSNLKTVSGNLFLNNSKIKNLPSDLKVGGSLDIRFSNIKNLPSGLKVYGDLYLSHTMISSLLSNLTVHGSLYLYNTPISKKYNEREIRKMIEDSGGYVGYVIYL